MIDCNGQATLIQPLALNQTESRIAVTCQVEENNIPFHLLRLRYKPFKVQWKKEVLPHQEAEK